MKDGQPEVNLSDAGIGRTFTGEYRRVSLRAIRSAMFIDRDGTLIKDIGYIKDPDDVELIPHAANAVRRMNYALRPVIVVTNQSGIARGILSEVDYERVRARVDDLLAERGAYIDAHYHCPHHPEFSGACDCRKPKLGLFERAIHEHAIDAASSLFVGNRWSDVEPALHYGARGVLVPSPETPPEEIERARREAEVAHTLTDVVHVILPGMTERTLPLRIAVLASGGGSNLQAILNHAAAASHAPAIQVVLVASNRGEAGALDRARAAGVPAAAIANTADGAALVRLLDSHRVECIALAGYLKLVPPEVTARWRGRIVNIHPALLPKFGGAGMYGRRVHEAVLAAGETESGATVHQVDDVYDRGAIIAQERVPVEAGDTAESLAARVLAAEHRLYPRTLDALARQLITSR